MSTSSSPWWAGSRGWWAGSRGWWVGPRGCVRVCWNLSNPDTNGQKKVSLLEKCPHFKMHARVVLGMGKG